MDVQSGMAPVQGGEIYYEMAGAGKTIILIHAGVADCRMWDDQFEVFASQYRVIRYDTRGYGRTTSADVAFSNRQDLLDLMTYLNVDKAFLIGVSRGGQIAVDFSLEFPQKVLGVIPVAAGLGGFQAEVPDRENEVFEEMEQLWEAGQLAPLVELEIEVWLDGFQRPPGSVTGALRARMRHMISNNYANHRHENLQPIVLRPPASTRLQEITAPMLVIYGDLDTSDTLASCSKLASEVYGAQKFVIAGTAHMLNMEKPAEFNKVVLDFLDKLQEPKR